MSSKKGDYAICIGMVPPWFMLHMGVERGGADIYNLTKIK